MKGAEDLTWKIAEGLEKHGGDCTWGVRKQGACKDDSVVAG